MVSVSLFSSSVFLNKTAQVEYVALSELFLHLVEFVRANSVKVAAVQLLLKNLRHTQVVQV